MKLIKVRCNDIKRKLSIVKTDNGYQFIGPIYEKSFDSLNKKGFVTQDKAVEALKKYNYTLS